MSVIVKWSGKEYSIDLSEGSNLVNVSCLKKAIETQTGVKVARQKLLNLKYKGETPLQVLVVLKLCN